MDPSTFQKRCMIEQLNIYNSIIWYLVKNQPASIAGERKNQRLGVEPSFFPQSVPRDGVGQVFLGFQKALAGRI